MKNIGVIGFGEIGMLHAGTNNALHDSRVVALAESSDFIQNAGSGFGTREGIYICLFGQYGMSIETSLAVAFIDGILIFTFFVGISAFIFWTTNQFNIEF